MTAHTPGTWTFFTTIDHAQTDRSRRYIKEPGERIRYITGGGQGLAHTVGLDAETDEANARLIAAAPDMYDVLRDLADTIQPCEPCGGTGGEAEDGELPEACRECDGVGKTISAQGEINRVLAALAKAEGK